jgi:hypothetical protein
VVMLSRTFPLSAGFRPEALPWAEEGPQEAPDFALAFLPPDENLPSTLAALAAAWPTTLLAGCEAVTQLAGGTLTTEGSLQLFWFASAATSVEARVIPGTVGSAPDAQRAATLARDAAAADGVLLLVDGLRFPIEPFLESLRGHLPGSRPAPAIAGGLASQGEPVTAAGARVFLGATVLEPCCLALLLHGIDVRLEVVRGWDPASPVYCVTRAAGNVLYEIDGEPATDWYRRFFTVDGALVPLPETAYRFPLIVEGPRPERQGIYRSLRFFDRPEGAVTFWGSLAVGDRVRLGMGNDRTLVETAGRIAAPIPPEAAILYSCVGRQQVLGDRAGAEAAAIHGALSGTSLSGFFTFGEIGPSSEGGLSFYNQTAILVLLSEMHP